MRSRPLVLGVALAVLLAAGCGGGGGGSAAGPAGTGTGTGSVPARGSAAAGRRVFEQARCGSCHAFAAADADGRIGPDLDDSGLGFADAYVWVRDGRGGMPSYGDRLTDRELANVAAFVVTRRQGG
jgi:mono/diheme cytochrome c family protein